MKKNAMCQIAVGVLSTCLAGAALAAGGPADLCNSGNIKRSEIVQTTNNNKTQFDYGYEGGRKLKFTFTRRIENKTGVNCVVQFNGGEDFYFKSEWKAGYTVSRADSNKIVLRSGAVTDLFSINANDITYQRAWTTGRAPADLTFNGVISGKGY